MEPLLGVLGGMGPLATADFVRKIALATPAIRDQDHWPLLVYSATRILDRSSFLVDGGPDPWPALHAAVSTLVGAGATHLAIPCNTAHHWAERVEEAAGIPLLHIADAVAARLAVRGAGTPRVALLATRGTLAARVYQRRLASRSLAWMVPGAAEQQLVDQAIALVKAGRPGAAGEKIGAVEVSLAERGATDVVLGCTELPLALDGVDPVPGLQRIDSVAALAEFCVASLRVAAGAPP